MTLLCLWSLWPSKIVAVLEGTEKFRALALCFRLKDHLFLFHYNPPTQMLVSVLQGEDVPLTEQTVSQV